MQLLCLTIIFNLAGPCVVNVYINYEKKFAFVEFRTVEETSNAMALDGIMFEGVSVRLRPIYWNLRACCSCCCSERGTCIRLPCTPMPYAHTTA